MAFHTWELGIGFFVERTRYWFLIPNYLHLITAMVGSDHYAYSARKGTVGNIIVLFQVSCNLVP